MSRALLRSDGCAGWRRFWHKWRHRPENAAEIVSIDLETTSLDPRRADILSIGAVLLRDGRLVMGQRLELFVRPPTTLTVDSIRIHKLRRADLEGQLPLKEALGQLLEFIGERPLLGYYLSFDRKVLNRHLKIELGTRLRNPSLEISSLYHRKVSRLFPNAHIDLRFDTLAKNLDIPVTGRHTALGDAHTVALMLLRLRKGPVPKTLSGMARSDG